MKVQNFALFGAIFALGACGVPDTKLLSELDDSDIESLCGEFEDTNRSVTCTGTGFEVTFDIGFETEASCVADTSPAPEGCTATVGDFRDCQDAWAAASDEDICAGNTPAACDFPADCIAGTAE